MDEILVRITVRNAGPDRAQIDVLPTLWFRNTWAWGGDERVPSIREDDGVLVAEHWELGRMFLATEGAPERLFCDNETNAHRLWGSEQSGYPKDAINEFIIVGDNDAVNPARCGTKCAPSSVMA